MTAEPTDRSDRTDRTAPLARRHPLADRRAALEAVTGDVTIALEPLVSAVDLRVDPEPAALAALGAALGGALPPTADAWTALADGQALRLGPDEWLLTSATTAPHHWEDRVDTLAAPHGGMAVDVSAQRVGVRLRGPAARDLLAFTCSLDLRPGAFGRGRCAQTLLGQAPVLLVAHGADDLAVLARTSFAGYVADRLLDHAGARTSRLAPV